MSLISDTQADLGGIRQAYPQVYVEDPRGEHWGGEWTDSDPIPVVRQKLGADQKFQMGLEVTSQTFKIYTELPGGVPPLKEEDRLKLDGMVLHVMSVVPIESPGSEGCIALCDAPEHAQG